VKIRNLKAGFFSCWDLHEEAELKNVKHNLTIVNSYVGYFKLITLGKAEFVNVRDVQISTWANASAIVENSTVTWCLNMRGMKDYVFIKDSIITRGDACFMDGRYAASTIMRGGDIHYVEFENTTINAPIYICSTYTYIKGGLTILTEEVDYIWGTVERNHPVGVEDKNREPVENAMLRLLDSDGNLIWNGTANSQGRANFNITFTDSNYTDTLRLKAVKGNYSATTDVGFLSDTPIVLTMRYFADLNTDGTINILDISVVAMAFGSTPEDPDWNVIADLNSDQVITY